MQMFSQGLTRTLADEKLVSAFAVVAGRPFVGYLRSVVAIITRSHFDLRALFLRTRGNLRSLGFRKVESRLCRIEIFHGSFQGATLWLS